jgi:hypothetical protein
MKKIKNIKQLKHEQERLHDRQIELEKNMRESWGKIKKNISPRTIAKDLVAECALQRFNVLGLGRLLRLF